MKGEFVSIYDRRGQNVGYIDDCGELRLRSVGPVDPDRHSDRLGYSGRKPLRWIWEGRGLHGQLVYHFQVMGGDVVRLNLLDPLNFAQSVQLETVFGRQWWDVVDAEEVREARCAAARRILQEQFDRDFGEATCSSLPASC